MNRRLAAHKQRKDFSLAEEAPPADAQSPASTRAAQAAARVAARYAKAPSYSEMHAAEARAALRAAEVVTRAALEAQVAAQTALANLESATEELIAREEAVVERKTAKSSVRKTTRTEAISVTPGAEAVHPLEIRWDPDMPVRPAGLPAVSASHERQRAGEAQANWWGSDAQAEASAAERAIETVEPAQPIHANLIEFPRELIATRRVRPRLSGSRHDDMGDLFGQLSIFEVDPSTISTEPAAPTTAAESPAPSWSGPAWQGIELDDLPREAAAQSQTSTELQLAPLGLRVMATMVDTALIAGVVSAIAVAAANMLHHAPTMKAAELGAFAVLLVTGVLYNALFLTLAGATPGMMFARISLCTFDDECPSRAQLRGRLGAALLSLLPVGLGLVWAVFDEDHLCWHDRLSRTYLRQC